MSQSAGVDQQMYEMSVRPSVRLSLCWSLTYDRVYIWSTMSTLSILAISGRESSQLMNKVLKYHSQHFMYWRDASLNTLGCCIRGMHLTIH